MTLFDQNLPAAVDMHCHLSDCGGYRSAIEGALILSVTNDPKSWLAMHKQSNPGNITWAIGLHPCTLTSGDRRLSVMIEAMKGAPAIGEIGLDYSPRARCSPVEQRRVLDQVLSRPEAKDRVVTLHSLGAAADIIAAVSSHGVKGAVLHWFLGSPAEIDAAIAADVYFSVNSSMVRSHRGRAALREMPPNRVLAETDAPFTRVGKTAARPGQVDSIERSLARLWDVDPMDIRRRLWTNLNALQSRLDVALFGSDPLPHGQH